MGDGVDDASELPVDEHDRELLRSFHSSSVLYRRLALEWRQRGHPYLRRNLGYRLPARSRASKARNPQHPQTSNTASSSSTLSHDSSAKTPAPLRETTREHGASAARESPPSLLSSSLPTQPARNSSPEHPAPSKAVSRARRIDRACWWRRARLGVDTYILEARVSSLSPLSHPARSNASQAHSHTSATVTFAIDTGPSVKASAQHNQQQGSPSPLRPRGNGAFVLKPSMTMSVALTGYNQDDKPRGLDSEFECPPAARLHVSATRGSECLLVIAQVQEPALDRSSRNVEYRSHRVPLSSLLASRRWQDERVQLTLMLTSNEEVSKRPPRRRLKGHRPSQTKKALRIKLDLCVVEEVTTRANNVWWLHASKHTAASKQGRTKASKRAGLERSPDEKAAVISVETPIIGGNGAENDSDGATSQALVNGREMPLAGTSLYRLKTNREHAQASLSENAHAPTSSQASPISRYPGPVPQNPHLATTASASFRKQVPHGRACFEDNSIPDAFTSTNKLSFYGLLAPFRHVVAANAEASCLIFLRFRSRQWALPLTPVLNCPWCGQSSASIYELVLHLSSEHPRFLVSIEVKAMECQVTLTLCETPAAHLNAATTHKQPSNWLVQGDTFMYCARWAAAPPSRLRDGWRVLLGMSAEVEPDSQHHLSPDYVPAISKGSALDLFRFFGKAHRRVVTSERLSSFQRPFFHTPFIENRDPLCEDNSEDEVEDDMSHLPPTRGVHRAWSSFVAKQPVVTKATMAKLCHKFVALHSCLLKHDRIAFLLHLHTLYSHGLLESDEAATILRQVPV